MSDNTASSSSLILGNISILAVGRLNSLPAGFVTVTTRIPSAPGWTLVIRTNFHMSDDALFFFKIANDPTSTLSLLDSQHPLWWSCGRYSVLHLFQKVRACIWTRFYLFNLLSGIPVLSGSASIVERPPTKKWRGVNTLKSDGSSDIGEVGLEFSSTSIWQSKVFISLNVRRPIEFTFNKCQFVYFITASHKPSKWEAVAAVVDIGQKSSWSNMK